jgi:hypothetical protein
MNNNKEYGQPGSAESPPSVVEADSRASDGARTIPTIYAWIGEDELGSGVVGIKQALVPAGMIPLAAMAHHLDRLTKRADVMEWQARLYGKKIRLCKFVMTEVVQETEAGE